MVDNRYINLARFTFHELNVLSDALALYFDPIRSDRDNEIAVHLQELTGQARLYKHRRNKVDCSDAFE